MSLIEGFIYFFLPVMHLGVWIVFGRVTFPFIFQFKHFKLIYSLALLLLFLILPGIVFSLLLLCFWPLPYFCCYKFIISAFIVLQSLDSKKQDFLKSFISKIFSHTEKLQNKADHSHVNSLHSIIIKLT